MESLVVSCAECQTQLVRNQRKFCSNLCRNRNNGRKTTVKDGGYSAIHHWLANNFGVANRCESDSCNGKSSRYHWALLSEKRYEHNRSNFTQLCASCHKKYDYKEESSILQASKIRGRKITVEHRAKISAGLKLAYKEGRR